MENINVIDETTFTEFGQPYTREFLEPMSVSQLKKLAQETASALKHRSSWIATTNKSALVDYLVTGQLPVSGSLPTNGQQTPSLAQYDLASVMAASIAPFLADRLKTAVDEETVDRIVNDRVSGLLDTVQTMLDGVSVPRTVEVLRLDNTKINVGLQHKQFDELLAYVSQRKNVYLVGPAASGKTQAAENVAEALGLEFSSISVCSQTPISALFGFMNAVGAYVPTEFRKRFEFGGVFLCDEFDNGNANTCAALNQATANGCCGFPDGMVAKHADFICIAAGNTFGNGADRQYVGRNQLDAATLDRFVFLDWEYDEQLETAICDAQGFPSDWTKYVQQVRASVASLKLRHVVSVRASLIGGQMIKAGVSRSRIEKTVLWKGLSNDEISKVVSNLR
jgi:MoxR-like ATPase